jgi:hypothetical protein
LTAVVRDAASGKWRLFERPLEVVVARDVGAVLPALEKIENECARHQRYAAGFLSYEAAPAFDAALKTQPAGDFPLLWFGLYYARVFDQLQELIRRGDTCQREKQRERVGLQVGADPIGVIDLVPESGQSAARRPSSSIAPAIASNRVP